MKCFPYVLLLIIVLMPNVLFAEQSAGTIKKKVTYKSHTEIDFTGDKIEGKIKSPAVFYIFQRKRSLGHEAARSPLSLGFHDEQMKQILKDAIKE